MHYAITQPSGWGQGYNKWLLEGDLQDGARDDGAECVLDGTALTKPTETKIEANSNELSDYDWPSTDILSGFTWRVAIPKFDWDLSTGGYYATFAAFDTATYSLPDDIFICNFTGDIDTDAAGTSGHVIEFNGTVVGDVTVDEEYIVIQDMTIEGTLNVSAANTIIQRCKISP